MWFGGCQSQVEQSLELNQQAEGVKKEEAGIHFVLQIRLKFHLPLFPRHAPPRPPISPSPFLPPPHNPIFLLTSTQREPVLSDCCAPGSGKIPWRKKWPPTPIFLPGESHGQRRLGGYSPRGHKESDTIE